MVKAMDEVFALCQKYNVPFGTTASGINGAKRWIDKGAKFFEAADEREFIFSGASSMINDYRKVLGIKVEGADRKKTIT